MSVREEISAILMLMGICIVVAAIGIQAIFQDLTSKEVLYTGLISSSLILAGALVGKWRIKI